MTCEGVLCGSGEDALAARGTPIAAAATAPTAMNAGVHLSNDDVIINHFPHTPGQGALRLGKNLRPDAPSWLKLTRNRCALIAIAAKNRTFHGGHRGLRWSRHPNRKGERDWVDDHIHLSPCLRQR
jgi:hypothetical protein